MSEDTTIRLESSQDVLLFESSSGALVSFRSKAVPDQEFILTESCQPVFVIQYLDEAQRFRQIGSGEAVEVEVSSADSPEDGGTTTLIAHFRQLGGLDLDVTVTVRATANDRYSRWSLSLQNDAGLSITDVQFPFVVSPYSLGGKPGTEAILLPFGPGVLLNGPKPEDLEPDCPHTWQIRPENGDCSHYPGLVVAQFLAYYNDRAGIFVSCQDSNGMIKLIMPVHREPGVRLGISHVGDWPQHGERQLEYDVVIGSFTGDWYTAADMYRDWSLQQKWAATPLSKRTDVPEWLLDSPPHIILRIQGELDIGPTAPNEAFLPYRKALPMLDKLSERIDAPIVPVIMSWERAGPWVYPDCFPPVGGEESLREFTEMARERGWRVGTFANGTRWVVGHFWSGYDGADYFAEHGGDRSVCRTHTGDLWSEQWDATWRPSHPACLGAPQTQEIAQEFVRTMTDLGLDWIQFLDQNVGCCTFPCFATDHDHPPAPGRWMTDRMEQLADYFTEVKTEQLARSKGQRQMVFSVETPVNEYFLPHFQCCDVRVIPPGHDARGHFPRPFHNMCYFVPLFHYLYHEFIVIQGGFGMGPEPYHLPIRNAYNLVVGEIPGAVMKSDGTLLNLDSTDWAPWDVEAGSNDDAVEMLAATAALRRGPAADFLVYGRMMQPAQVGEVRTMRWQHDGKDHQIPAVFHAAWQAPDGRLGLVLANWTTETQEITVSDSRLGPTVTQHGSAPSLDSQTCQTSSGELSVTLPALSCTLLDTATGE
ncbi:MAG TPA: hypothetical protein DIT01_10715 [Lentisphaeria bacterium]|nr:hypothetical protein [Lentisphaeria bacterium]|tara:strand:- start:1023 stop:3308 length:2286 start_codon:yes stop_codon:yes gene_type:complete